MTGSICPRTRSMSAKVPHCRCLRRRQKILKVLIMLREMERTLLTKKVGYFFISTHSQLLHKQCRSFLEDRGYLTIASADFDHESFCHDGILVVRNSDLNGPIHFDIGYRVANKAFHSSLHLTSDVSSSGGKGVVRPAWNSDRASCARWSNRPALISSWICLSHSSANLEEIHNGNAALRSIFHRRVAQTAYCAPKGIFRKIAASQRRMMPLLNGKNKR
jgi:hypothetical protein